MKRILSLWLTAALFAAQPCYAVVTVGFGQSSAPASSFVGSPGTAEGFEGPGITLTSQLSETDPDGVISCSSTTAAIDGTYGCLFSNGSSAAFTNYIKADIGTTDDSFSLSWKIKTPTTSSTYSNYYFFRSRLDDAPSSSGTDDSSFILFDNNYTDCKIVLYAYFGASGSGQDTSVSLSYDTHYNILLKRTNNTTGGLVLEIRNSSNTLVDTLTVDSSNKSTRYFYWFDMQTGNDLYLDSIQYDSTNP